eukprot:SAG25_NODE_181_length_12544_cov_32.416472_7_plen_116_part_00
MTAAEGNISHFHNVNTGHSTHNTQLPVHNLELGSHRFLCTKLTFATVVPNLVYSARNTVIVNGAVIMRGRRVLTMDEEEVLRDARAAGALVAAAVAADPLSRDMALLQPMREAKL